MILPQHVPDSIFRLAALMSDSIPDLIDRLRALPDPEWHTWSESLPALGPGDEAGLIELATRRALLEAGPEASDRWVPVHAWRCLGQLGSEAAVGPLLELLDAYEDDDWITHDFPRICAGIGSASVTPLARFAGDPSRGVYARMSAVEALEAVAQQVPGQHERCAEALISILRGFQGQDRTLNAIVVSRLVNLRVTEAAPIMEDAFAADQVDLMHMGDWEDVQIELGLLDERLTPRRRSAPWWPGEVPDDGPPLPDWRSVGSAGADLLERTLAAASPQRTGIVATPRELEGFLFAIACAPDVVQVSEWLELVVDERLTRSLEPAEVRALLGYVIALYGRIQEVVNEPAFGPPEGFFVPDLAANFEPDAEASQWCHEFVLGHGWLEDEWEAGDDGDAPLGTLMVILSFFASRDLAARYVREVRGGRHTVEDLASEVRASWADALADYAAAGRAILRARLARDRRQPARASAAERTGRNEPCPCGSERKFKKCCGAVT